MVNVRNLRFLNVGNLLRISEHCQKLTFLKRSNSLRRGLSPLEKILIEVIPILLMIGLIPLIGNDYLLTGLYLIIICVSLLMKYEKKDLLFLLFGLGVMTLSEFIFISTGVETFNRASFIGMPIWLPFLWAYAFVVIKRVVIILK